MISHSVCIRPQIKYQENWKILNKVKFYKTTHQFQVIFKCLWVSYCANTANEENNSKLRRGLQSKWRNVPTPPLRDFSPSARPSGCKARTVEYQGNPPGLESLVWLLMGIQTIPNLKIGFVLHAYAIQIVCMSFAFVALPFVRAGFAL